MTGTPTAFARGYAARKSIGSTISRSTYLRACQIDPPDVSSRKARLTALRRAVLGLQSTVEFRGGQAAREQETLQ